VAIYPADQEVPPHDAAVRFERPIVWDAASAAAPCLRSVWDTARSAMPSGRASDTEGDGDAIRPTRASHTIGRSEATAASCGGPLDPQDRSPQGLLAVDRDRSLLFGARGRVLHPRRWGRRTADPYAALYRERGVANQYEKVHIFIQFKRLRDDPLPGRAVGCTQVGVDAPGLRQDRT